MRAVAAVARGARQPAGVPIHPEAGRPTPWLAGPAPPGPAGPRGPTPWARCPRIGAEVPEAWLAFVHLSTWARPRAGR